MSVRKGYNRYFIIFQEEDKGYGIAIDKQPTGYAKIEVRNGKCKITVYAQNIKQEKGPYNFCMIDTEKSPADIVRLGEVRIDDIGTGETFWEYNEDNIGGSGQSVDKYNVAILLAEGQPLVAPLSGFTGKGKIPWKDKLTEGLEGSAGADMRNIASYNEGNQVDENSDEMVQVHEELDEEALKFRDYEDQIRNEAERLSKMWTTTQTQEVNHPYTNGEDDIQQQYEEIEHQNRSHGHGKGHGKSESCHDKTPKHKHHEMDCEMESSSPEHTDYVKSSCDHNEHKEHMHYEHKFVPEMKGYECEEHHSSSHDHNEYMEEHQQHKHKEGKTYADVFHYLLNEFEEITDKFKCHRMENTRWWKIPARYDEKMIDEKHYPFMCTIFHLSMAYPHIDYVKYFYRMGHYYFGIKYDEANEVKYLMYGIPGHNSIKEQPYMGMTGFNKWVGDAMDQMGVWIMFYNPRTGNFMIEKNK